MTSLSLQNKQDSLRTQELDLRGLGTPYCVLLQLHYININ
jgi:hypothetical protein